MNICTAAERATLARTQCDAESFERSTTMGEKATRWMLGVAATAVATIAPFVSHAWESNTTNINLAVASNFYGVPPSNSAITDIINAFQAANPKYTVTVVDNGATGTLASHIIDGNKLG
jgi:endoglucanase Acf2